MTATPGQVETLDISPWGQSVRPYADWLNGLDRAAARHWALRLCSSDLASVEGAVAEAVAWDFLGHRVDSIAPGALATGGPDFRCERSGFTFYVEVTNLSRAVVTEWTGLSEGLHGPGHYKDLTGLIKREVAGKSGQGRGLDAPYLVFVTTLHSTASHLCVNRAHVEHVLHSTTAIAGDFDPDKGEVVGPLRQITRMELSAFTLKGTVDAARQNVSAVLVGGFGTCADDRVLGVRHPETVRPFDPILLAGVAFFEFAVWPPDPRIVTRWTLPAHAARNRSWCAPG